MRILTFDAEADGFVEEASVIHCIYAVDYYTGDKYLGYDRDDLVPRSRKYDMSIQDCVDIMSEYDVIIGHNIIKYDVDLIHKLTGVDLSSKILIDTLVISQTLNPDRELPNGCPTSVHNPVTNKLELITPHSVAAWAYRFGDKKVAIHDWREFNADILKRCMGDVGIQEQILQELLKEAGGITLEELL